ncbi:putative HTH-type transcriptional regulator [bacterium HR28]|nr:putative HTH-type transcriptional regulator [bacterium HR28]
MTLPPFARILREYREKHDVSQYRLAKAVGVDHSYISRLESGQRRPSYDIVLSIARALDLQGEEKKTLFAAAGFLPPEELEALFSWQRLAQPEREGER